VLQIVAIGCLVLSAVALGHQQVPEAKPSQKAAVDQPEAGQPAAGQESG